MMTIIAGISVAAFAFCAALYKGRTGWHWSVLALVAFAVFWLVSAVTLLLAGVHPSFAAADKDLAVFAGGLTALIVLAILIAVPFRPKRRSAPLDGLRQERPR